MNTRILLPLAAISALALAACDNTPAPTQPEPNADLGTEVETIEVEPVVTDTPETTEDLGATIEEIEQEAAETFDRIMEQTEDAGTQMMQMGTNAMQAIGQATEDTGELLDQQIDAIVSGAESLRDDNMSDEQKLEIVATARAAAESTARQMGRTGDDVTAAGDAAETRVRAVLGL